jgi:hypothetical protein
MSTEVQANHLSTKPKQSNSFKGQNNYVLYKNARIIQKCLIYIIGLSAKLSDRNVLGSKEYFGQYGTITKLVINNNKGYVTKGVNGPTYSAYVAYSNSFEACLAILATDNFSINGNIIRSSFGTTKYCTYFLKGYDCPNPSCLFIHNFVSSDEIINKDDMVFDKNVFVQQQVLAMKIADVFNPEVKKKVAELQRIHQAILPHPLDIYNKDFTVEYQRKLIGEESLKSKIFNNNEYENYFGDQGAATSLQAREEKYKILAARQSSEVSNCSKLTNFNSFNESKDIKIKYSFNEGRDISKLSSSFSKKPKSRFPFVSEGDCGMNDTIEIPEIALEIVNSSLAYFNSFKRFFALCIGLSSTKYHNKSNWSDCI